MRNVLRIFIFLAVMHLARCLLDWWDVNRVSWSNRKRFVQVESQLMTDLDKLVSDLNDIRFMYEESPHYEIGYVYAEIMEKYRKMVDNVYRLSTFPQSMFHTQTYLEQQQNLYLDNYHLICMIHEIPKKYAHNTEFKVLDQAVQAGDTASLKLNFEEQRATYLAAEKERKRIDRLKLRRKKQLQRAEAITDIIKNMGGTHITGGTDPANMKRPPKRQSTSHRGVTQSPRYHEYGWEVNYEWWG